MCMMLERPQDYSTDEIRDALRRKFNKFGSKEMMPRATRELVERGHRELERRHGTQGTIR